MSKITNTLTVDKFMADLHLRYAGNVKHLYSKQLYKACFACDAAYSDNKDLAKITISGKILKERAFGDAGNRNYDRYQRALESIVYKFFDNITGSGLSVNQQLAEKLQKPVIKKNEKKKNLCKI